MSLIDTIGPVILLTLLGLAVLLGVTAWVWLSLIPRLQRYRKQNQVTQRLLDYNAQAKAVVADLICELETNKNLQTELPQRVIDELWELQGVQLTRIPRTNRKGLPQ